MGSLFIHLVLRRMEALAASSAGGIKLREEIDGVSHIDVASCTSITCLAIFKYIEKVAEYLYIVAFGICTIWIVYSGLRIIASGGDSSTRSEAIQHITWAIIGLAVLLFSGSILQLLNDIFFV